MHLSFGFSSSKYLIACSYSLVSFFTLSQILVNGKNDLKHNKLTIEIQTHSKA